MDTENLILKPSNDYVRKNAEPFPIFPYVSDGESSVLPEEEGKAIWFLQAMLIAIAERYSGIDGVVLNGKNDEATRNAIRYIHKCEEGENCDGALNRRTWNSVARLFNAI